MTERHSRQVTESLETVLRVTIQYAIKNKWVIAELEETIQNEVFESNAFKALPKFSREYLIGYYSGIVFMLKNEGYSQ